MEESYSEKIEHILVRKQHRNSSTNDDQRVKNLDRRANQAQANAASGRPGIVCHPCPRRCSLDASSTRLERRFSRLQRHRAILAGDGQPLGAAMEEPHSERGLPPSEQGPDMGRFARWITGYHLLSVSGTMN